MLKIEVANYPYLSQDKKRKSLVKVAVLRQVQFRAPCVRSVAPFRIPAESTKIVGTRLPWNKWRRLIKCISKTVADFMKCISVCHVSQRSGATRPDMRKWLWTKFRMFAREFEQFQSSFCDWLSKVVKLRSVDGFPILVFTWTIFKIYSQIYWFWGLGILMSSKIRTSLSSITNYQS
jgi:hypothetical protein